MAASLVQLATDAVVLNIDHLIGWPPPGSDRFRFFIGPIPALPGPIIIRCLFERQQLSKWHLQNLLHPGLRGIDFSCLTRGVTDDWLSVLWNCPALHVLNLKGCSKVSAKALNQLLGQLPELRWVDLSGCQVRDDTVQQLARSSDPAGLQHLALASCGRVTDTSMVPLLRAARGLQTLDLTGTAVSAAVLAELFGGHHKQLRDLRLGLVDLSDFVGFLSGHASLARLAIPATGCLAEGVAALCAGVHRPRLLRRLDLGGCALASLEPLQRFTHLQHLLLNGCQGITTHALDELLAHGGSSLCVLSLATTTAPVKLRLVTQCCPRLQWLDLHDAVVRLDDEDEDGAMQPGGEALALRLEFCDLRGTVVEVEDDEHVMLGDHGQLEHAVFDLWPELRALALSGFDVTSLAALPDSRAGRSLASLYLSAFSTGTEQQFLPLLRLLPALQAAVLDGPRQVDWLEVKGIQIELPHLALSVHRASATVWRDFQLQFGPVPDGQDDHDDGDDDDDDDDDDEEKEDDDTDDQ